MTTKTHRHTRSSQEIVLNRKDLIIQQQAQKIQNLENQLRSQQRAANDHIADLEGRIQTLTEENEQLQSTLVTVAHKTIRLIDETSWLYAETETLDIKNEQLESEKRALSEDLLYLFQQIGHFPKKR